LRAVRLYRRVPWSPLGVGLCLHGYDEDANDDMCACASAACACAC
jgi:hypothetical protein